MTGADERALQMRALFSAQDSGQRWDLMVYVLEHLVSYLHERYPEQLPRIRVGLAPQEPPAA